MEFLFNNTKNKLPTLTLIDLFKFVHFYILRAKYYTWVNLFCNNLQIMYPNTGKGGVVRGQLHQVYTSKSSGVKRLLWKTCSICNTRHHFNHM